MKSTIAIVMLIAAAASQAASYHIYKCHDTDLDIYVSVSNQDENGNRVLTPFIADELCKDVDSNSAANGINAVTMSSQDYQELMSMIESSELDANTVIARTYEMLKSQREARRRNYRYTERRNDYFQNQCSVPERIAHQMGVSWNSFNFVPGCRL
ncbi:MAG: hypothetical protein CME65_02875 [Halobacteriovoraceae bacterium]|nr:hypothetical protein [Halobacteriovoraceae bacterium]|tara:strand:- start:4346 stop:4810 length:465 start_codon:yes stop_codon:yes gene_type:complete